MTALPPSPCWNSAASAAAARGPGCLVIPPGTMGSLDQLGAARESGLTAVAYRSTRPPHGFAGTVIAGWFDLDVMTVPLRVRAGPPTSLVAAPPMRDMAACEPSMP